MNNTSQQIRESESIRNNAHRINLEYHLDLITLDEWYAKTEEVVKDHEEYINKWYKNKKS